MKRFGRVISALASACLLALSACSGVTDSAGPPASNAPAETPRFDPTVARTPAASKSLMLASDWRPPAPTRTAPAHPKRTVQPRKHWGVPAKTVGPNPTDAELRAVTRFVEEPLRPVPGTSSPEETAALAAALREKPHDERGIDAIDRFLDAYPASRWAPVLHLNLAAISYKTGYFQDALAHWKAGWELAKGGHDAVSKGLANLSLAELAKMNARIGRHAEVLALLDEAQKRTLTGDARNKIGDASEGAWMMRHRPGVSFQCGPLALESVAKAQNVDIAKRPSFLEDHPSTSNGFSIPEVQRMSADLGLKLQIAKREVGAPMIVPAVVHWKLGHFAAVIQEVNGVFLVKDPTFANDITLTSNALDQEASGYFLVPAGPLPSGWTPATATETAHLRGRGNTKVIPDLVADDDHQVGGTCQSNRGSLAMATYRFHTLAASLHVEDTPIAYEPAVGPAIRVKVEYNQRGSGWTTNWSKHIDSPWTETKEIGLPGGGFATYQIIHAGSFPENRKKGAVFTPLESPAYAWKVSFPDGREEYYEQVIGAPVEMPIGNPQPPPAYLSRIVDPQGNEANVEYDSTDAPTRISRIVDATNGATVFHYDYSGEPDLLTSVEDPYGRTATFTYAMAADTPVLQSTEDPYGIVSSFTYNADGVIVSMTTPYGTTTFNVSGAYVNQDQDLIRYVEATDPLGQKERVEFNIGVFTGVPYGLPAPQPDVTKINYLAAYNNYRNTLYWDKLAMRLGPYNYQKARIYHWVHLDSNQVDGYLESETNQVEDRIFYNYPGQAGPVSAAIWTPPSVGLPSAIGRVVKDASGNNQTQVTKFIYNANYNVIRVTDPIGRATILDYATNGIDVVDVKQTTSSGDTTMSTFAYSGTPPHRPSSVTDGAGQTTSYTYTSTGQVETVTNAKGEVTTFTYGTTPASETSDAYKRLVSVTGDVPGGNRSFTYDGFGRVRTVTDADGYTLTYDYDSLDRLRTVTRPDGSYEQLEYADHSLVASRDREGRWTRHMYNGVMQRVVTQDPSLRTTQFEWCGCGELTRFVDGNGSITAWDRDVIGRVTKKTHPDGKYETFTYDLSGRLSTAVDAMLPSRTTTYTYNVDDRLAKKDYSDPATPDVTYTYDAYFPRLTTRVDGSGTTSFTYHPYAASTLGAGQVASVNGPLANDTQKLTYDELGRLKKLQIVDDATGTVPSYSEEYTFDSRGRVTTVANNLGSTTYAFVGSSNRPSAVTYANGMQTAYDYFGTTGDLVLKQIKNLTSGGTPSVISQFDYTYRPDRSIETWKVDQGSGAKTWTFGYDDARELSSAALRDASEALLESNTYGYDKAGNRIQVGNGTTAPKNYETNSVNQLLSERDHGRTTFAGFVDEPATVKVNGKSAKVMSTDGGAPFKFEGVVDLDAGANTVTVEAKDGQNNTSTKTYAVTTTGTAKTYEYDFNGNLRFEKQPSGTVIREYQWDQQNRLVKALIGTHESDYDYDGASRRWRITEKESGTQTKQETFVWCGSKICQKRSGSTVVRSYFGQGFEESGPTKYFYTREHLGSVREVVGSDGTAVASRLSYDPWGKATETGAGALSDFTYTGHYYDRATGLNLAQYRGYDPSVGRWISRDPLGLAGGLNVYRYSNNRPVDAIDPDGLWPREGFELRDQAKDGGYGPSEAATEGAVVAVAAAGAAVASAEAVELAAWSALQRLGPVGRFIGALLGNTARGQIEKGNTAGKCGDVAKAIPGTLVQSPMGKVPHFARMTGDVVTDPTLRDNLKAYGRAFEDIAVGQTTFTKLEWDSLVARLPDIIRKSGE